MLLKSISSQGQGQGQGFFICHIIVIQGITRSEMQSNQVRSVTVQNNKNTNYISNITQGHTYGKKRRNKNKMCNEIKKCKTIRCAKNNNCAKDNEMCKRQWDVQKNNKMCKKTIRCTKKENKKQCTGKTSLQCTESEALRIKRLDKHTRQSPGT